MIKKNIIVTGGNKGIGLGLVKKLSKDHNVIFTVRSEDKGNETLDLLKELNISSNFVVMDVVSSKSVDDAFLKIKNLFKKIDLLINNAGILIPGLKYNIPAVETDEEDILQTFNTNTLGVLRVTRSSAPLLSNGSRVINISSGMGQLNDMGMGSTAYRLSKTALNALTVILSQELLPENIKLNAICPGWVQTDMGGANADMTVDESVSNIVKFAFSDNFPTGKYLRDGKILPW